jgi:hypothetical protein
MLVFQVEDQNFSMISCRQQRSVRREGDDIGNGGKSLVAMPARGVAIC